MPHPILRITLFDPAPIAAKDQLHDAAVRFVIHIRESEGCFNLPRPQFPAPYQRSWYLRFDAEITANGQPHTFRDIDGVIAGVDDNSDSALAQVQASRDDRLIRRKQLAR